MIVEVCCNSIASALAAQNAGAHRIEFCVGLPLGGLTPSMGLLETYKKEIQIPTRVLIRPRAGNFTYSPTEFNSMVKDVQYCSSLGYEGVVSGILNLDYTIDIHRTQVLMEAFGHRTFTFHRAFDWVVNPIEALTQLAALKVHTVLTSGGAQKAIEGLEVLKELQQLSLPITVMPGGCVTPKNAAHFKAAGFKALHLSGGELETVLDPPPKIPMHSTTFVPDHQIYTTQESIITRVLAAIK